jgi:predicted DNA-binding transcriptional regulator YafY
VAIDKVERLANLVAALLHSARPLTIKEIVAEVDGYPAGAESARIAFERDKRELRGEGVDVELLEPSPTLEGDEPRYRINPATYYLPDLGLTAEEAVALNVALSAVQIDGLDPESARWKLGPGPVGQVASAEGPHLQLSVPPLLPRLHDAIGRRLPVSFSYGGVTRTVEPWGLLCRDGFWYLTGLDRLRDGERNFRVDRIEGDLIIDEQASPIDDAPAGFRPDQAVPDEPWELGPGEAVIARVRVDQSMATRVEDEVGADAVIERRSDGSIVVQLDVRSPEGLQSWLFGLLDHAVVLEPESLRQSIVARLGEMTAR